MASEDINTGPTSEDPTPRDASDAAPRPKSLFVNTFKRDSGAKSSRSNDKKTVSVCPQTFKDALDGFTESANVAIEVLSQLAQIHPFIHAPVIAFKLVMTLELKRRDNNAKVQAVNVEMQSMMTVLLQLQNIKDPASFEPDSGLEDLLAEITDYIKESASLCDWYIKKSTIRKYLKSYIYEARLAECANRFVEFGSKLQRALSIHTALGIDTANETLERQSAQLDDIQQQMRELFLMLDSPREREIRDLIQTTGGAQACITDNKVLQTLIDKSGENKNKSGSSGRGDTLQKLKKSLLSELSEDVDKALEQNLLLFEGKLDIQLREIDFAITKQGDRIIAFFSGGHERIIDPHIREIWREMGWKSTVKARHFVLALRDYYLGGPHAEDPVPPPLPSQTLLSPPMTAHSMSKEASDYFSYVDKSTADDAWATAYVNVSYLQAIAEAIDDDGSGFINVREVNDFTTMRPAGWSVFQWLAYWAAGWQSSISQYTDKIYRLLRKIHKLRDKIRPDNLTILDYYFDEWSFYRLERLLRSTTKAEFPISSELTRLRDEFSSSEEARLENNLEKISYNIDSTGTVSLVTGPGRIERYIYPLLYLLLKRHIQTIQLARIYTLHFDEMDDKCIPLKNVFSVFDSRLQELSAIFKQMHLDPEIHFQNYAFGMFNTSFGDITWALNNYKLHDVWNDLPYESGEDDDIKTCPTNIPLSILKYGAQSPLVLSTSTSLDLADLNIDLDVVHGAWAGFCMKDVLGRSIPHEGLFRIVFGETLNDNGTRSGNARSFMGKLEMNYSTTQIDEAHHQIDFVMAYDDGYWIRCIGTFDVNSSIISGDWHSSLSLSERRPIPGNSPVPPISPDSDASQIVTDYTKTSTYQTVSDSDSSSQGDRTLGTFQLSRTPAHLARFRYGQEEFTNSPAKARWTFACSAVLYDVRRRGLAKPHVLSRLRDARRFTELHLKNKMFRNDNCQQSDYTDDEIFELRELEGRICPSVDYFYYSIACYLFERIPYHLGRACGGKFCAEADERQTIIQSRYMCVVCIDQSLTDTLDFCANCRDTEETDDYPSHDLSHSLIRSHRVIHDCDRAWMIQEARDMSERIKEAFRTRSSPKPEQDSKELGDESSEDEDDSLICRLCKKSLSLPCWACLECEPDRLVCSDCDTEHQIPPPPEKMVTNSVAKIQEMHAMHVMLWIRDDEKVEVPDDDQLTRVEDRLSVLEELVEERLEKIEDRFTAVERQLGERFQAMEKTFGLVGERFDNRLASLEARFDSLEELIKDFISKSRLV